jgi:hypothetical protein
MVVEIAMLADVRQRGIDPELLAVQGTRCGQPRSVSGKEVHHGGTAAPCHDGKSNQKGESQERV